MSDTIKKYKVVISGAYGEANFGDDMLMLSIFNLLGKYFYTSEIAFMVAQKAQYLEELVPGVTCYTKEEVRHFETDILMHGGGTQFYSFTYDKNEMKIFTLIRKVRKIFSRNSLPQLFYKALYRNNNALLHKYCFALGVGIGPFLGGNKEVAKQELARCRFLAVRDKKSLRMCNEWGLSQVFKGADICFNTSLWDMHMPEVPNYRSADSVAFIIRDWPHTKSGIDHVPYLLETARRLREKSQRAQFVLFSSNDTECKKILNVHNENYQLWDPATMTPRLFLQMLSSFDLIISSRYHGIVLTSLLGIPAIAIAIEPKLEELSVTFDNELLLWSESNGTDKLVEMAMLQLKNKPILAQAFKEVCMKEAELAEYMSNKLFNEFDKILKKGRE